MNFLIVSFIILKLLIPDCAAYRFLGIFPYNGKSHDIMFDALSRGLVKNGHQIDVITHFPPKKTVKNYKCVVDLSGTLPQMVNNITYEFTRHFAGQQTIFAAYYFGTRLCHLMNLDRMQKFIENLKAGHDYDALLVEGFAASCYFGFGHLLKIPVIQVVTSPEFPWNSDYQRNDDNPGIVPNFFKESKIMNFFERLDNFYLMFSSIYQFHTISHPSQTDLMRKYLSPDIPDIREVEKSIALTLINTHPVFYCNKPILPSVIQVAGLHIDKSVDELSPELKSWMDESVHGVLYFSLGSLLVIDSLPADKLASIFQFFKKIAPIRVLVKLMNKDKLPFDVPENVFTLPWIPQLPLLRHNNTIVFMTHGGIMGAYEALYFGVPTIMIPVFSDQFKNAKIFVEKNLSIMLEMNEITEEKLMVSLNKILTFDRYRESAKYYADIFRDRPASPMKTAIFWIEYVVQNGPDALRSPAIEFTHWQLLLFDVYSFIFFLIIVVIFLFHTLLKYVLKLF